MALEWRDTTRTTEPLRKAAVTPLRLCHNCDTLLVPFLSQGQQPISNGFRHPADTTPERLYPIQYAVCETCWLVQLLDQPPADVLFHADYPFLSGSSPGMVAYYATMAGELLERWTPSAVIEVGCNDGTLLQHFRTLPHLGIEPAGNVARMAVADKGLNVLAAPFSVETACTIAASGSAWRRADLIIATHCVTHLSALHSFFEGVDVLLTRTGVLVLEDPSLDAIITAGDFAQMYDEHATVLSLPAVAAVAAGHELEIIDAEPQPVHGGSMRITLARTGQYPPAARVAERLLAERYLTKPWPYKTFAERANVTLAHLSELLRSLHARGKVIVGYGASTKLVLVLNRLNLPAGVIAAVSDTTPTKIGKVMPGTHEPIISREDAEALRPDVFLCGAYVHRTWLLPNEEAFLAKGGKFIFWVPTVHAVGAEDASL